MHDKGELQCCVRQTRVLVRRCLMAVECWRVSVSQMKDASMGDVMKDTANVKALEEQLDAPERRLRIKALRELKHLADTGKISVDAPRPWVNMHCHSFYSYNAHGFSPSRIAWESFRRGLNASGVVDFDVLEAVDEVLEASDAIHARFTAGIESRVYVKEFEGSVLNSPNEPAIAYYMGQGFVRLPSANSKAAATLYRMAECAAARNRAMMDRLNAFLEDVVLDYEKDVLPLTPAGNATERHMLAAYDSKAREVMPDRRRRAHFWAGKLRVAEREIARAMDNPVEFRNLARQRLMKYGSPGYVAPDPRSFPTLEAAVDMIRACGAMPMYAWLNGTTPGEEDAELLLDFFCSAGAVGLNIIPNRNWNLHDPSEKASKVGKLNEIIRLAKERHLPICVGTEMNSVAQPWVDHFDVPELKPHVETFLAGAQIIWGHALLLRHGGFGYLSPQSEVVFARDTLRKNRFFREVGARPVPHGVALKALREASRNGDERGVLRALPAT